MVNTPSETLRMLVVDHPRALAALSRRLARVDWLHLVASVSDAHEAVDVATRLRPDVCVCDVRLRGADGVALVRGIASLPHAPAVVVHTSFLDDHARERLTEAGATAFVLKEAGLASLIESLAALRVDRGDAAAGG